jgi:hypothetical protein
MTMDTLIYFPLGWRISRSKALGSRQHIAHRGRVPLPTTRSRHAARMSASAISLSVVAPAFLISRMIGSTLAAWLSATAPMVSNATLRAWASFGPPSFRCAISPEMK